MILYYDLDKMLRIKFWVGFGQDLKDILGFKFEVMKDFDKFRVELRKMEREYKILEKEIKIIINLILQVFLVIENKKNVQLEFEVIKLKQLV